MKNFSISGKQMTIFCVCRQIPEDQARRAKEEVRQDYGARAFNEKAASTDERDLKQLEEEIHSRGNRQAQENGFNCGTCRTAFRQLIHEDLDDEGQIDKNEGPNSAHTPCCRTGPRGGSPDECWPD